MADNTKLQYIIELLTQGDTKKAQEEFEKLNKSAGTATSGVAGLTKGFGALFAVLGGTSLIFQSIEAFLEQERAIAKLNGALKSTGEFTAELSKELQDLADQMAKTSLFADEKILNVIAKLTAMGAKKQDVERLTRATLDLATLMDGDLNTAARQMALAVGGAGADAFDRLKLNIDETLGPTEKFNAALKEIEKRAGGQAAEQVKGLAGEFAQLKKDVDAAKEAIGGIALSMYSGGRRAFRSLILGQDIDNTPSMQDIAGTGPKLPLSGESNAALMKLMGIGPGMVTSSGLDAADITAFYDQLATMDEESIKALNEEYEIKRKIEERNAQLLFQQAGIRDAVVATSGAYEHLQENLLHVGVFATEALSSGIVDSLFAIVEGSKNASEAFKEFAKSFTSDVSKMIFKAYTLYILEKLIGFATSASAPSGPVGDFNMNPGVPNLAASGGQFLKKFAGGGMAELSSPTYFPNFNVLAGEAGREVMTVLSRPSMVNFNGLAAQVGFAGGKRMAITSADGLAARAGGGGGGAGGTLVIEVRVSQGSEAKIVKAALENVTVHMQQDTTLSRATKNLTK